MNWPAQCAAVVPCRDEAEFIGPLVKAVRQRLPAVFVVDDGSRDATAQLAGQAGATVLRHTVNLGKGAALRTGWNAARRCGFDWALCLDGDGQHSPEDIAGFLECAERTGARLVVGNRMGESSGMPWVRRTANRWMSRRLSVAAGCPLPDSQCGFRLMELHAWAALPTRANHFEIESELLLSFIREGLAVEFVPVRVIYNRERSKINPLMDSYRWFRWYAGARKAGRRDELPLEGISLRPGFTR